jgi:hypothetical protein
MVVNDLGGEAVANSDDVSGVRRRRSDAPDFVTSERRFRAAADGCTGGGPSAPPRRDPTT